MKREVKEIGALIDLIAEVEAIKERIKSLRRGEHRNARALEKLERDIKQSISDVADRVEQSLRDFNIELKESVGKSYDVIERTNSETNSRLNSLEKEIETGIETSIRELRRSIEDVNFRYSENLEKTTAPILKDLKTLQDKVRDFISSVESDRRVIDLSLRTARYFAPGVAFLLSTVLGIYSSDVRKEGQELSKEFQQYKKDEDKRYERLEKRLTEVERLDAGGVVGGRSRGQ